jgi:hypothetical protein
LDARTIRSACDFLTGACSCEIKDKNPGLDLLMVADWGSVKPQSAPTQLFSLLALEPETPDATPGKSPQQPDPTATVLAIPPGAGEATPVTVASERVAGVERVAAEVVAREAGAHSAGSDGPTTSGPAVTRGLVWSGLAVTLAAGILMAIVWRFTARV